MVLFIILGVVVLMTFIVLGVLFFMLSKEGQKTEEAVPVTDLTQLKKELSNQLFEQNDLRTVEKGNEVIPVFEAKVSLPTQEAQPSKEDDAYKKRAQQLEDELLAISKKADGQSGEAHQLIQTLTKENELLKSRQVDLELAQQKLTEIQGEAANLKSENINLQTQLDSTDAKVRLLEEQMTAVKIQMGEEISRANAVVFEMNREKETLLATYKVDPDEALHGELESLKSEQIQLKQQYGDLVEKHRELTQSNAQLIEKNDSLQYELIKAKAQSSGLERVSFNYKNQLEDFFKKVNAVQVTNDHLSQVKNRLEGMVEEVKLQNEDLVKKDQLAQFELEQNRSRLQSLEREYENLKARAGGGI